MITKRKLSPGKDTDATAQGSTKSQRNDTYRWPPTKITYIHFFSKTRLFQFLVENTILHNL